MALGASVTFDSGVVLSIGTISVCLVLFVGLTTSSAHIDDSMSVPRVDFLARGNLGALDNVYNSVIMASKYHLSCS